MRPEGSEAQPLKGSCLAFFTMYHKFWIVVLQMAPNKPFAVFFAPRYAKGVSIEFMSSNPA